MIGDKIKKLRNDLSMTQQELATKLSISPSTVGMYEQNRRLPDINTVIKLADIFTVTSDYLLGINQTSSLEYTDDKSNNITKFEMDTTFADRLEFLCKKHNIDLNEKKDFFGISYCSIIDIRFNRMPSLTEILKISSFFNVSCDYLLGRSNYQRLILTDEEELLSYYNELTKKDKLWIIGQIIDIIKKSEEELSTATDSSLIKVQTKAKSLA